MKYKPVLLALAFLFAACVPTTQPQPSITSEASALLDKALETHGGAALAGVKTFYIHGLVSDAQPGFTLENGTELFAWIDFERKRTRFEYRQNGQKVAASINAPQNSITFFRGTQIPTTYNQGPNESLKDVIYDDITGLRFGSKGRSKILIDGNLNAVGITGTVLQVQTQGTPENYILDDQAKVIGFTKIANGKRRVTVIEQYVTKAGILYYGQAAYYEDGKLQYRVRNLEVEPNITLDEKLFQDI